MNKRGGTTRGRRTGRPDTRAEILAVARRRFLADGYQAVTLRAIAEDAGVDVALISYYFGSKKGVFGAVLALSANPPELLLEALPGDPATLPERVLRGLLRTWDSPEQGKPLRVMVGAAVDDPEVTRLLREVIEREMVDRIAEHLGGTGARSRAGAFATQLAGVVFARYVIELEPVASMPADELVRSLAPGMRAVLFPPGRRPSTSRPPTGD